MKGAKQTGPRDEVAEALEVMERASKKILKSKATARAYLLKYGFITKSGKLSKRYGG